MTLEEAKKLAKKYRSEIEYHNKKYYEEDSPEIDDYEYDMLLRKLENLEKEFPKILSTQKSPTLKVGGKALEKFSPVNHKIKMESLHDSFSEEEIISFDKRVRNVVNFPSYVVEPKIDGLSVSIEYKNGELFRASTRGNGEVGEDITENILTISNIPKVLSKKISFLEVRGEVFISKENFLKLLKSQENQGLKTFKNPRNAAAGSLRQKNSLIASERHLEIIIFNIQQIEGYDLKSHKESLDFLKNLSFEVPPFYNLFSEIDDVIKEIRRIGKIKDSLDFAVDGAVVKLDSLEKRNILGSTSKFPRWAEAYKYPPEERETELLDIEIKVGRTGILSPTGILKPVFLSGTTVSRVALHNQDFIKEKNIKIGDTLLVRKAGEIIPEVVRSIASKKDGKKFIFPKICPSCGCKVIKNEEEVAIRCVNSNCPEQFANNLIHFVSKNAMDIEGLGEAMILKLIQNKIVSSAVDFYKIKKEDLLKIERIKEKSSENLIESIQNSKNKPLDKFIFALGIPNVGQKASKLIAQKFKTLEKIMDATENDISEIEGIGKIIAKSIKNYFSLPQNIKLMQEFKNCGLNLTYQKNNEKNIFFNQTFVLTGTLEKYTRNEATELIEKFGGKVVKSVSKNVSYVVAGENAGSKLLKAQSLNLKIIDENEFQKILNI